MMPKTRIFAYAALAALLFALPQTALAQSADTISGAATAIGPDIIAINNQRIVLLGIDAPEANQTCGDGPNIWHCADTSMAVLDQTVKAGTVTCQLSGAPDPFGKRGGVCMVGDKDVARTMVQQGLALVYAHDPESKNYLADQAAAKKAKVGLWAAGVRFDLPWQYRMAHNHTPFK
jgi:endonuclease YncB( thermonuclease family)